MRHDLSTWSATEAAHGPVDYEVGFLGDLMGLGAKNLLIDPSLPRFFHGVDALAFNLEGLYEDRYRPVLLSQTTRHFRHLDELRRSFPEIRLIAGLANNHVDDVSQAGFDLSLVELHAREIEHLGLRNTGDVLLSPGLVLAARTYWKGKEMTRALTLDEPLDSEGQQLLFLHQGHEFHRGPSLEEELRVTTLPDSIIGVLAHHTHSPQSIEAGKRFVAWSLGNFAVKYGSRPVNWGIALRLSLGRVAGVWKITGWQYRFIKNYPSRQSVFVRVEDFPK